MTLLITTTLALAVASYFAGLTLGKLLFSPQR
jgi:hypothetical protein